MNKRYPDLNIGIVEDDIVSYPFLHIDLLESKGIKLKDWIKQDFPEYEVVEEIFPSLTLHRKFKLRKIVYTYKII